MTFLNLVLIIAIANGATLADGAKVKLEDYTPHDRKFGELTC
jgi:hypothetical protein